MLCLIFIKTSILLSTLPLSLRNTWASSMPPLGDRPFSSFPLFSNSKRGDREKISLKCIHRNFFEHQSCNKHATTGNEYSNILSKPEPRLDLMSWMCPSRETPSLPSRKERRMEGRKGTIGTRIGTSSFSSSSLHSPPFSNWLVWRGATSPSALLRRRGLASGCGPQPVTTTPTGAEGAVAAPHRWSFSF